MTTKTPTVVSVLNLKGGVGKTTVTALLARYASSEGYNVLAVDLDPQANLSQALMGEIQYENFMKNREPSVVELFDDYIPASPRDPAPTPPESARFIQDTKHKCLKIIPSRFHFSDNLIRSGRPDEKILAKFISRETVDVDLILIDCAPTESILTKAAYHASRYVLIPVKTELFSTIGFPLMKESLDQFRNNHPAHTIDVCGILVNESDTKYASYSEHTTSAREDIERMAKEYKWRILGNKMTFSRGYRTLIEGGSRRGFGMSNASREWRQWTKEIVDAIGLKKEK